MVQWLRPHASIAGAQVQTVGRGTKIPQATQWWPKRFAKQGQKMLSCHYICFCFGKLFFIS